ncbi:MAG: hypothetical protein A2Y81_07730 [Nitrospirae bacterium RBG_13_43_8]|nr:MAG: hypothetical protein A2Y81_07730 [Nitrospirae bacterium RBG_13_43_8]
MVKDHFEALETALENSKFKAILIIDYLINFLGCLVLSELTKKHKGSEIAKNKNISKLTAGEWARNIEMWISEFSPQDKTKALASIKEEFFQNEDSPKLKDYIKRWIQLRNVLSHDVILADERTLSELIAAKLFDTFRYLDFFIDSLLKVVNHCQNILDSDFFHYQADNNALFIYAGIDEDSRDIEFKHFKIRPISMSRKNFSLPFREVFLSLSPTPPNILSGEDFITVEMKTSRPIVYQNDFELWINRKFVARKSYQNYVDGNTIKFSTNDIAFEDGAPNEVEVKAIRNGKDQAYDAKVISIYSKVPDAKIIWMATEGIKFPVDKLSTVKLRLQSVFEINDIEPILLEYPESILPSEERPIVKQQDTNYLAEFNILSTQIGEITIKVDVAYTNKIGKKKSQTVDLKLVCTPNFFEPDFEGESRKSVIANMRSIRRNYLIIGEGGVGKSRLIGEYFYPLGNKPNQITAISSVPIAYQFEELLKIPSHKKENKIAKIMDWFKKEAVTGVERYFWIKDCHEIRDDKDRELLRTISQICSDAGNNIMFFLESRDETWGDNARKFIEEVKLTDAIVIPLGRLNEEELSNIIDSVFKPNKFDFILKRVLPEKSDGIVYILLEYLKYLYDLGVFVIEENKMWANQDLSNLEDILKTLDFRKALRMNIDYCLKILDKKNLRDKARDLLRYLCFDSIDFEILHRLLNIDRLSLQHIIDTFESNYLLRRQENKYEFHHQLKRDFCEDNFLPDSIKYDYLIELLVYPDFSFYLCPLFYDNERYLKDKFMNLTEPRLKEKAEGLLRNIEDDDVPENHINVLHKYYKVLSVDSILYHIELALDEYYAERYFGERYINFHPLKEKIDHLIKAKKLYDVSLYETDPALKISLHDDKTPEERFARIKIVSKQYDLLQTFYEEYLKISPPWGEEAHREHMFDWEFLRLVLKLTDIFLSNNNFLDKTYKTLSDIYFYLEYAGWHDQDIYTSIAHLQGLRILSNPEKKDEYLNNYKEYFDKIFSLPFTKEYSIAMNFLEYHKKYIMKDYPEMLSKVSKYISDMEIALSSDEESEDTN